MNNQSQLFGIDNAAYVQRRSDCSAQFSAKVARLEAQLLKEQKARLLAEKTRDNLNAMVGRQCDRINELVALVRSLQESQPQPTNFGAMPLEVWRRLVQLCHPDKHGGSAAANNATQWLNQNKPPL